MLKKVFIVFLLAPLHLIAQKFPVSKIPDSLKEGANAVKRYEELGIVIKSPGKAVIKHKYAITILNESGDKFSYYYNSYDKLSSLQDITGYLYNADGKELKKVKKKDIQDVSSDDEMSLMTDDRIKRHSFFYKTYPYTVEYEDEKELDGIFFLPRWQPLLSFDFAVEESNYWVEVPENYQLRYKQFNYNKAPLITNNGKKQVFSWKVNNQKSIEYEPLMPSFTDVTTTVYVAPNDFTIGGYNGNMSTWQNFGKFIADLNKSRDELPENIKKDIQSLVSGVTSTEEKVKILYEYLQKNTRYISIQMGIGSWQPFEAKFVATKKYGDCKALSNYMVSVLKEAGIKANYVVIKSGDNKVGLWEDFPAPYFNHAVTCVPNGKDTIWLECTSQTASAGFMGSFTGNRKAIMIDENGGHIVRTPNYLTNENLQLRKVTAEINKEGTLVADVKTVFTGVQQELQHSLIYNYSDEQRKNYLNRYISLPTYVVEKNEYKETKGKVPVIVENLKIVSAGYANVSSKRLFITPNLFNKGGKLSSDKPRKFDIEIDYAYKDIDTIVIKIPEGYTTEALPKDVSLASKFGRYSIQFLIKGDQIDVLRIYEINEANYPASDYAELVKFYNEIAKADRSKIVMLKKE
ncbi:MAG: DUF3857 and transglutaminase domain-containing protein [Chitinophagaceae bacterium]|jgi:hypothetical protein|nr:DUF3857 and transglutaminase domain-containing protein [Chitinophagaceae bacterium]